MSAATILTPGLDALRAGCLARSHELYIDGAEKQLDRVLNYVEAGDVEAYTELEIVSVGL